MDLSTTLVLILRLWILWKELSMEMIPKLSHYINLGIAKIMEHVSMGHRTRVYALAVSSPSFFIKNILTACLE